MLLAPLAAMVVAAAVLVGGSAWRLLARRDHRCVVVSRPAACTICEAVLGGHGAGGHVLCACGAASPHLLGPELLRWRAEHQGVAWPALPARAGDGPAAHTEGGLDTELEELREAERRTIARARRNPDPRTPQVLGEAESRDVNQS